MKYLALLLLASCVTTRPNCQVTESGKFNNTVFTILECYRLPMCQEGDIECWNDTCCIDEKNDHGKYTCVRRD